MNTETLNGPSDTVSISPGSSNFKCSSLIFGRPVAFTVPGVALPCGKRLINILVL